MSKKEFDYTNQLRFKQIMLEQQLKLKKLIAERELTESKDNISQDVDLKSIKGIGDKTLNTLISN